MKRNSTCKSCPQGAICNGESDVRPLANYWMDPSIKDVASAFLECQFEGPCCPNGNCTSDQACKPGFTGPLCAQCEATAPYQWGGGCFSCSSSSPGWPTLAFLLVFLGTGLYYFLPKLEGFFVSDLAVFYQVSRYLVSLANPFMPLYGLSWCIMPINDATKLSLNLGLPFILAAMLSLWYGFDLALATWKRFMAESQESGATPVPGWLYTSKKHQNAVTSALGLFLLCYTPLVSICFTLFSCRSANQLSLLTFQPGVGCWNGPHIAMLSVGVIVLAAIIIAVPVVILLKTYRQELVDPRKQQGFIGAILAPFRLRYIWYIHVFLFERFLIPLIRISYGVDEWNQTISLFFLIWVWLMPWAFLQPYTSVIDNTLKVGTHLCALGLCSLKLVRIASSENPINLNMGNSALLVSWNDTVLWECVFLLAPLLLLPYKIFQAKYPILARNIEGRSEDKGPEAAEDANPKSARFKSTGGNLN
ncbi:uncharacterized protein BJ171DRAFT_169040 [Polychytrium aggregatum]|uniref:uncharacterized protein n=1 Tax=Polychytrium aggregatum TaxID=110093 RepID=UPI0022FECD8D|nr:uncharacterized protein BJ171DRAFT_169040 [Polychytrium aggregatum]KAI9208823.1 hypothetical protein BJ171DRAFT_169040 [Polychytrium aggregatum]